MNDLSDVLVEDVDITRTLTAYQEGYRATVGAVNPYKIGSIRCGDWNEGFMDMKARLPMRTGFYYGKHTDL